jgi:hypothetical protein
MRDDAKTVRADLEKQMGFIPAMRMLARLDAADGEPVSIEDLWGVSGGKWTRRYQYIQLVKKYVELVDGKKLCNQPGVGYWLSTGETDKIAEGIKETRRMTMHGARLQTTMALIDREQIKTVSDMNAYGFLVAMDAMAQTIDRMKPVLAALGQGRSMVGGDAIEMRALTDGVPAEIVMDARSPVPHRE